MASTAPILVRTERAAHLLGTAPERPELEDVCAVGLSQPVEPPRAVAGLDSSDYHMGNAELE